MAANSCVRFLFVVCFSCLVWGQNFGPYYFPNETAAFTVDDECCVDKSASIVFGPYNDTHFFMNIDVYGNYWFSIAFADSGRVAGNMLGADAWVFANFQGATGITLLEYTLANRSIGTPDADAAQDLIVNSLYFGTVLNNPYYSLNIQRAYNTGSRDDYVLTLAGDLGLLWALGTDMYMNSASTHGTFRDYMILDLAGTTLNPTPSPTYPVTIPPSRSPTIKPTKAPLDVGATGNPTPSPTIHPTPYPTDATTNPTVFPTTVKPTQSPLMPGQTGNPSPAPTPSPTFRPTYPPTTKTPTLPLGQTKDPTPMPTTSTTATTSGSPTVSPSSETLSSADIMGENGMLVIIFGIIILVICFCLALLFYCLLQKRRSKKRHEKRQNMLEVEQFKQQQGMEIDKENKRVVSASAVVERDDDDDDEQQVDHDFIAMNSEEEDDNQYTINMTATNEEYIPDPRSHSKRRKRRKKKRRPHKHRSYDDSDSDDGRHQRFQRDVSGSDDEHKLDSAEEYQDRGRKHRSRSRKHKKRKPGHSKHRRGKSKKHGSSKFSKRTSVKYGDEDRGIVRSKAKKRKHRYDDDSD